MFGLFVGADGPMFLGQFQHVRTRQGTRFPFRTVVATGLQASRIETMNARVGIAFGCTDARRASVKTTASVLMTRRQLAGRMIRCIRPATAMPEFGFGGIDVFYPVFIPFFGDGGAELGDVVWHGEVPCVVVCVLYG